MNGKPTLIAIEVSYKDKDGYYYVLTYSKGVLITI